MAFLAPCDIVEVGNVQVSSVKFSCNTSAFTGKLV